MAASINKSVKIGAGEEAGGASSVNGSISVGDNATVTGNLKTVNGSIRVDAGASIEKASTVNGGLRLADDVKAEGLVDRQRQHQCRPKRGYRWGDQRRERQDICRHRHHRQR